MRLPTPAPTAPAFPAAARVVVVAASAGGLRALDTVLGGLPPDLQAAVLVVQHLDPNHPSHLAHILTRTTRLAVREARHGDALECGVVFVAPPGVHLTVGKMDRISLAAGPPVHYVKPSADRLFRSAAETYGPRVIAVVLTGMGTDGANATLAVHSMGGLVIVQDESTSEFFGMPRAAIAQGHVDQVLGIGAIAGAVTNLVGVGPLS
jgi:two-component system, chemotaxis family, protein-glutamate methylesterase/glutaminase